MHRIKSNVEFPDGGF